MKRQERELLALLIQQHERHTQDLLAVIMKMIELSQDTAQDEGPPAPGLPVPGIHDKHIPPEPAEHLTGYR